MDKTLNLSVVILGQIHKQPYKQVKSLCIVENFGFFLFPCRYIYDSYYIKAFVQDFFSERYFK